MALIDPFKGSLNPKPYRIHLEELWAPLLPYSPNPQSAKIAFRHLGECKLCPRKRRPEAAKEASRLRAGFLCKVQGLGPTNEA